MTIWSVERGSTILSQSNSCSSAHQHYTSLPSRSAQSSDLNSVCESFLQYVSSLGPSFGSTPHVPCSRDSAGALSPLATSAPGLKLDNLTIKTFLFSMPSCMYEPESLLEENMPLVALRQQSYLRFSHTSSAFTSAPASITYLPYHIAFPLYVASPLKSGPIQPSFTSNSTSLPPYVTLLE